MLDINVCIVKLLIMFVGDHVSFFWFQTNHHTLLMTSFAALLAPVCLRCSAMVSYFNDVSDDHHSMATSFAGRLLGASLFLG